MSRIENLLLGHCPDGVEYRTLGELEDAHLVKLGRGAVISKTDLMGNPGDYPVYSSSASLAGEFGRYGKYMFDDERITWSIDGGGRFFYRPPHRYSVTNVCGWMTVDREVILTRFLYYALISAWAGETFDYTRKAHPSVIRSVYRVPVPPLEVQGEIVRVLDLFQSLEAELEAELEARRCQYAHYRDSLLDFTERGVRWMTLGEAGELFGGLSGKCKADFDSGNARYVTYMNVFSNIVTDVEGEDRVQINDGERQRRLRRGDILFTGSSESADECGMSSVVTKEPPEPLYLNSFCIGYRMADPELFNPEFAKHLFRSTPMRRQIVQTANGVTRFNVAKSRLAKVSIPIPPVEVQERIAGILDKFDALVNDLSIGLPAELAARRQQYQYYRDRLLTFEEAA